MLIRKEGQSQLWSVLGVPLGCRLTRRPADLLSGGRRGLLTDQLLALMVLLCAPAST